MSILRRQNAVPDPLAGTGRSFGRSRRWFAAMGRPSLHRRLLKFLLVPVLLALVADALLIYMAALVYSNHVHDRDLIGEADALAGFVVREELPGQLSPKARILLEYAREESDYFRIASSRAGLLAENGRMSPQPPQPRAGGDAILSDARVGNTAVRVATLALNSNRGDGEVLFVSMAETLHDRHLKAREILAIASPMLALLILVVLVQVWLGVGHGLRIIERLTARLAAQPDGIVSISDADVPVELLPLTRTIDELFTRLKRILAVQERFIADAAHQLRTPLAGLSLHVQRALADPHSSTLAETLHHIDDLCQRAARTSSQLLVLSRADSNAAHASDRTCFDAARQVTEVLRQRVDEAIARQVDLGYEGGTSPIMLEGDPGLFLDLLDNLLDNALRYAGQGSSITVSLRRVEAGVLLVVEDNGPGIEDAYLARLGERFFRVPGQAQSGSGLGLAIVSQIADDFHAVVHFRHGRHHRGLRIELVFPESKGR